MTTIGVIDDRDEDRKLIVSGINIEINNANWSILDSRPLPSLQDYPTWISQNKICSLVIDELLDENTQDGIAADYRGHDLVDYLRQHFPTLPIFVITAYSSDKTLQERFRDVEEIIDRRAFYREAPKYVPHITRAAQRYLDAFQSELSELSEFSRKVALGEFISEADQNRVDAIRGHLGIAYSIDSISNLSDWIDEAKTIIEEIEELRKDVEGKLGSKK